LFPSSVTVATLAGTKAEGKPEEYTAAVANWRGRRGSIGQRGRPGPIVPQWQLPGGAKKDEDVVARADELNLAMIFTGTRHFNH
jgi:hypothetical protein